VKPEKKQKIKCFVSFINLSFIRGTPVESPTKQKIKFFVISKFIIYTRHHCRNSKKQKIKIEGEGEKVSCRRISEMRCNVKEVHHDIWSYHNRRKCSIRFLLISYAGKMCHNDHVMNHHSEAIFSHTEYVIQDAAE